MQGSSNVANVFLYQTISLPEACKKLLALIEECSHPAADSTWTCGLSDFDAATFLSAAQGVLRLAYKSRDCNLEMYGLGLADVVSDSFSQECLEEAFSRAQSGNTGQIYFGATRFDKDRNVSTEWQQFAREIFVLPLLLVIKSDQACCLHVHYKHESILAWPVWLDHVKTLLRAVIEASFQKMHALLCFERAVLPSKIIYQQKVNHALMALAQSGHDKVVLGRRKTLSFKYPCDPAQLFFRLVSRQQNAFLFYFDMGKGAAFFGASPELLFRRKQNLVETESLAGTRARVGSVIVDNKLGQELLKSDKDNKEHAVVSRHIEHEFERFGITDFFASDIAVMTLPYVQHLVKRYRGIVKKPVDDALLIRALHPTPAVCGHDRDWALAFIREHEGFDRGYYAGPIGFFSADETEFAVGIRSALYYEQNLYIYAAGGIVLGSESDQEWGELDNKEKSILSIFDDQEFLRSP